MTKFKVGDKVRLISNNSSSINKIGDIGIITELTEVDCRVKVDGESDYSNWSLFCDLKLVETPIEIED
jgi:hypothetical protein